MIKLLLIFSVSFLVVATAQPIVTDTTNRQILKWDSTYNVESKFFRADFDYETRYYSSVKKGDRLIAEYFRHDDTSFLFVKYDTSGKRLQRGLIRLAKEIFDSAVVQIPDYTLDPDGSKALFKDTTIYDYSYRKNGVWWEKDSIGMIWKGNYSNGLREGKWEEGILVCCNEMPERSNDFLYDLVRPFLKHFYIKGFEIPQYKDSLFWPKIKGSWYYHHSLKPNRLVFEKIQGSNDLLFNSVNQLILKYDLAKLKSTNASLTAKWSQNMDSLVINTDEKPFTFRVVRLDNQYLILEKMN